MALDRQSIEKKDFPIARRGYDPDAVDAHLRGLADQIEALARSARPPSESLAAAASEQVRSIVEAAEAAAADIQRQAGDEARGYVGKVAESTSGMLERIAAMEHELVALMESLRTGSSRLNADLQLLERDLGSVENAVVPRPRSEPESAGSGAVAEGADASPGPAPATRDNGTEDESARLIALNMVMNNTPREEIERYLAEHFRLTDRRGLLDDVYSSFQN